MKMEKEFYKKLMGLVLPIAFQNFMLAVVSASDAILLGFLNQDALSAVALAGQIQFVHSLFIMAFVIGTTILVAQYWGKEDAVSIEIIFAYVLKLVGIVSVVFSLAALICPELLMKIFTSDTTLIQMGSAFLRVVSISYLLSGISQIYLCMLKNMECASKSTLISSTAVVVNILLNIILIFGMLGAPAMGIKGSAVATVIARAIELLWSVWSLRQRNVIHLKWNYLRNTDLMLKKDFWRFTAPVLGNEIAWGGGFTMFSVIMGHLGSDAVAANAIANIVKNLIVCISLGIGSGGSIMVGNELGRGMLDKAKDYGKKLVQFSIICGVISGVILLSIRPAILHFSTLSQEATQLLSMMLLICAYYLIGKSVNSTVISGIFCAGGDTRFGLICDTITMWVIVIPLGFIAAFYLKLPVIIVYFILNMDEIIKLPAVYKHYKQYKWVKDLTRI
ncbi:MATE family efflux transporter [Anaeromicropila herbilytica]|uniref:MATE family efflux transporter n=1 Tax=Anaeromicropila herbilytica TaxID=2785025 RepID=A0A7R7EM23_9FIRM|nr:MATE family efflux transporter [Anaeromicropila herbilytica]BCN31111.1 MATE family efflux transporter [Anaeromicropila herbilytica]